MAELFKHNRNIKAEENLCSYAFCLGTIRMEETCGEEGIGHQANIEKKVRRNRNTTNERTNGRLAYLTRIDRSSFSLAADLFVRGIRTRRRKRRFILNEDLFVEQQWDL